MSAKLLAVAAAVGLVVVLGSASFSQDYRRPGCSLRCSGSYQCVSYDQMCDGSADCPNGEDEICDDSTVGALELPKCIIGESQFCDGVRDCSDGSDEAKCPPTTLPALVNLGTDWLWTWPLVGAVLCALVCLAVALSLRHMRLKRQQSRDARRRAAADRLAASATGAAAGGGPSAAGAGLRSLQLNLPSYDEATGHEAPPFAGGCPNMGYCVGPADMPPDYLEAVREAERQSALEKQQQPLQRYAPPAAASQRLVAASDEVDARLVTLDGGLGLRRQPPPAGFEPSVPSHRRCKPPGYACTAAAAPPPASGSVATVPGKLVTAPPTPSAPPVHAAGFPNAPPPSSSSLPVFVTAGSFDEAVVSGSRCTDFAVAGGVQSQPRSSGSSSSIEYAGGAMLHSMC